MREPWGAVGTEFGRGGGGVGSCCALERGLVSDCAATTCGWRLEWRVTRRTGVDETSSVDGVGSIVVAGNKSNVSVANDVTQVI